MKDLDLILLDHKQAALDKLVFERACKSLKKVESILVKGIINKIGQAAGQKGGFSQPREEKEIEVWELDITHVEVVLLQFLDRAFELELFLEEETGSWNDIVLRGLQGLRGVTGVPSCYNYVQCPVPKPLGVLEPFRSLLSMVMAPNMKMLILESDIFELQLSVGVISCWHSFLEAGRLIIIADQQTKLVEASRLISRLHAMLVSLGHQKPFHQILLNAFDHNTLYLEPSPHMQKTIYLALDKHLQAVRSTCKLFTPSSPIILLCKPQTNLDLLRSSPKIAHLVPCYQYTSLHNSSLTSTHQQTHSPTHPAISDFLESQMPIPISVLVNRAFTFSLQSWAGDRGIGTVSELLYFDWSTSDNNREMSVIEAGIQHKQAQPQEQNLGYPSCSGFEPTIGVQQKVAEMLCWLFSKEVRKVLIWVDKVVELPGVYEVLQIIRRNTSLQELIVTDLIGSSDEEQHWENDDPKLRQLGEIQSDQYHIVICHGDHYPFEIFRFNVQVCWYWSPQPTSRSAYSKGTRNYLKIATRRFNMIHISMFSKNQSTNFRSLRVDQMFATSGINKDLYPSGSVYKNSVGLNDAYNGPISFWRSALQTSTKAQCKVLALKGLHEVLSISDNLSETEKLDKLQPVEPVTQASSVANTPVPVLAFKQLGQLACPHVPKLPELLCTRSTAASSKSLRNKSREPVCKLKRNQKTSFGSLRNITGIKQGN